MIPMPRIFCLAALKSRPDFMRTERVSRSGETGVKRERLSVEGTVQDWMTNACPPCAVSAVVSSRKTLAWGGLRSSKVFLKSSMQLGAPSISIVAPAGVLRTYPVNPSSPARR